MMIPLVVIILLSLSNLLTGFRSIRPFLTSRPITRPALASLRAPRQRTQVLATLNLPILDCLPSTQPSSLAVHPGDPMPCEGSQALPAAVDSTQLVDIPYYVFINSKSGGKAGSRLLSQLTALVHPEYLCDLHRENPKYKLQAASQKANGTELHVLCCGGDGTMRWIMDEAQALGISSTITYALVPMGTGNDLHNHFSARHAVTMEDLLADPLHALSATPDPGRLFDRWSIALHTEPTPGVVQIAQHALRQTNNTAIQGVQRAANLVKAATMSVAGFAKRGALQLVKKASAARGVAMSAIGRTKLLTMFKQSKGGEKVVRMGRSVFTIMNGTAVRAIKKMSNLTMPLLQSLREHRTGTQRKAPIRSNQSMSFNNYFGIGVDGDVVNAFHEMRSHHPWLFPHWLINRAWYGYFWLARALQRGYVGGATEQMTVTCDGQPVDMKGFQGLILCNIRSYGGGAVLWPHGLDIGELFDDAEELDDTEEQVATEVDADHTMDLTAVQHANEQQSSGDGLLEAVGIHGFTHLVQIKTGTGGVPLAQGKVFKVSRAPPLRCRGAHPLLPGGDQEAYAHASGW